MMDTMSIPELLAPAGNEKALHAGISAGADAVYLGLDQFNARRNADNFALDTLGEACDYAHLRGARIYVTMNTIILPEELDRALECARQAYLCGIDALIVQDIGLAALVSRCIPALRLHVSTQMNIHSAYGIEAAASLGAKRVTLARELSLPEIDHLASVAHGLGVEVEAFGHGALCVCYSGQCFMSSMIGGRSANRGLCAQACRLPYKLIDGFDPDRELKSPGEFLLSPKDLCSVDMLDRLQVAGVDSIKIEGRMKSPEYVASVVSVYRDVLDRLYDRLSDKLSTSCEDAPGHECDPASSIRVNSRIGSTDAEKEKLASVFSRGFSPAYLIGERGNEMMSYQRPNNRGQFVGRVKTIRDNIAHVACEITLEAGDLLEFWTRKGNVVFELPAGFESGRKTAYIPLDELDAKVQKNDRVFRVRSSKASFKDDPREPRVPVVGRISIKLGKPLRVDFRVASLADIQRCGNKLASMKISASIVRKLHALSARSGIGLKAVAEGVMVEAARSKAISAQEAAEHVDRMGSTPFELCRLDADIDEGVGLGFSQIHRCRASALENLQEALLAAYKDRRLEKSRSVLREKSHGFKPEFEICAIATNPDCARVAKRSGADTIYVPALNYKYAQAQTSGTLDKNPRQAGYPKNCKLIMPVVDHDHVMESRNANADDGDVELAALSHINGEHRIGIDVWELVHSGDEVMVESLSSLQHALDIDSKIEVGPHLPIVNPASIDVARAFGAKTVWLSPELNIHQIRELLSECNIEFGMTVFGAQELMVTEHCLLMSEAACSQDCASCARRKKPHRLRDRKGYEFPVVTDALGRSHLYNSVRLDIVGSLGELIDAGVSKFMIDTTLMDAEQAAQATGRLVHALKQVRSGGSDIDKLPNTTTGHLFRGVL